MLRLSFNTHIFWEQHCSQNMYWFACFLNYILISLHTSDNLWGFFMDFIVLINVLIPPFSKTLSLSLLIPNILPSCYFQYHMCFSILLLSMFTCVPISRSFFMYISFISVNPYPVPLFHIPVIPSVPHLCCYFTYSLLPPLYRRICYHTGPFLVSIYTRL